MHYVGGAILKRELRDLEERYGASVGDLTTDELERLVLACRKVERPFSNVNMALVERPVRVCEGAYLWPITAGAQIWLEEFAAEWWKPDSMMYKWARVYALAHAREPEAFASLQDKSSARKAVVKTLLRFTCHGAELQDAIDRCYGIGEQVAPERPGKKRRSEVRAQTDFSSLVARLEVESGIPSGSWLWRRSLVQTMRAYVELHEFAAAFAGGERARMKDELDEAMNDLARLKRDIHVRLMAEKAEKADKGGEESAG